MFCSQCGSRLHAERNAADRPRYRERHGMLCESNGCSVVSEVIDAQLGEIWASLELPAEWRETIARLATVDGAVEQRAALEAKKRRIGTAFMDGAVGEPEYRRRVAEIDADLALMAPASAPVYKEAAALLRDLPRVWSRATPDEQRRLLAPLWLPCT